MPFFLLDPISGLVSYVRTMAVYSTVAQALPRVALPNAVVRVSVVNYSSVVVCLALL